MRSSHLIAGLLLEPEFGTLIMEGTDDGQVKNSASVGRPAVKKIKASR